MPKDLLFENHGTIGLVRPLTPDGEAFLRETAPEDAQFFGGALVFEPRYLEGIVAAAGEHGLQLVDDPSPEQIGDKSRRDAEAQRAFRRGPAAGSEP